MNQNTSEQNCDSNREPHGTGKQNFEVISKIEVNDGMTEVHMRKTCFTNFK